MTRRLVLRALACGLASALDDPYRHSKQGKVPVVGSLMLTAGPNDPIIETIRRELRSLGYVDGQTIHIEYRGAQGQVDRLPQLAQELVDLRVDAIVVGAESIARAAKQATTTIPIIMVAFDYDPVAAGLVDSLSRPGGNVTGIFPLTSDLVGKNLALLKELLPRRSHVAVLYDAFGTRQLEALKSAARKLGMQLQLVEVRPPYRLQRGIQRRERKKPDAMMVLSSPHFYVARDQIAKLALQYKLPTIGQGDPLVRAGGLISYGPDQLATFGRTAYFVDRVLKGASPAALPVEQPTQYLLVVNLKTAKALGITIPQSILLRADEVDPVRRPRCTRVAHSLCHDAVATLVSLALVTLLNLRRGSCVSASSTRNRPPRHRVDAVRSGNAFASWATWRARTSLLRHAGPRAEPSVCLR